MKSAVSVEPPRRRAALAVAEEAEAAALAMKVDALGRWVGSHCAAEGKQKKLIWRLAAYLIPTERVDTQ